MRIASIAASVPQESISNKAMIQHIDQLNRAKFGDALTPVLHDLENMMARSGLRNRRFLQADEPWFDHLERAVKQACQSTETPIASVDCVIYASVFRTTLEPSMASLVANALGIRRAMCFDVSEACSGWLRAASVAQAMLDSGTVKTVLLLTAEACGRWTGYGSDAFSFESLDDHTWSFASMTVGSGFTATLLQPSQSDWKFTWAADNSLAKLSLFPLMFPKGSDWQMGELDAQGKRPGVFACHTDSLYSSGWRQVARLIESEKAALQNAAVFLPHANSYRPYVELGQKLAPDTPIVSVYPEWGNLVTSSIPAAICQAQEQGQLQRGDDLFIAVPASGLSIGLASLTF
ncbi:MAG: 3-oxoacyl-ACP synthase III family protein [Burkholderiaceae bacterium]